MQLVRHASGEVDDLVPYADDVDERFHAWLALQERGGRTFTVDQLGWLALLKDHVAVNLDVRMDDLWAHPFTERGGAVRATEVFGRGALGPLLAEINDALSA